MSQGISVPRTFKPSHWFSPLSQRGNGEKGVLTGAISNLVSSIIIIIIIVHREKSAAN